MDVCIHSFIPNHFKKHYLHLLFSLTRTNNYHAQQSFYTNYPDHVLIIPLSHLPIVRKKMVTQNPHLSKWACFIWRFILLRSENGGTKPNLSVLGVEQFDELEPKE